MTRYRRGLIARLRASGTDIVWIAELIPSEATEWSPLEQWSPRQVMLHLRDVEYGVNLARIQATVLEENPEFPRFDADAWRASNRPESQSYEQLVADFAAGRRALTATLERLDVDDWLRPARTAAFGPATLEMLAERAYLHTLDHLQQLIGLRRAFLRERTRSPA
ncbi:MAG: hypothetical protein KatS3mg061_3114 [Dehalococcoidia bacterium]|nr:MAG: hypothetical protein KatS3mg061_3114 [Dehalococcoidia bacterium]